MVFHFVILSDEVDDFRREISIDAEATFLDLHDVLLKSCGYKKDQMTSFFICGSEWNKQQEITLIEMNDDPKMESWTMDKTHLNDLLKAEKTKMLFLFDTICERYLFIQLKTIEERRHLKTAEVTVSKGKAPVQMMDIDKIGLNDSSEEGGMYGEDGYNPDELDPEGFMNLEDLSDEEY